MPGIATAVGTPFAKIRVAFTGIFTDGTETWRLIARDGELCWDHTLTTTGFDGTEDVDWYNAQSAS